MSGLLQEESESWIGRSEVTRDIITEPLIAKFRATFPKNSIWTQAAVPLGLHWCIAHAVTGASDLGADGHPEKGGFIPPIPLNRRMWAGGALRFFGSFGAGDEVEKRSTIAGLRQTQGSNGPLIFLTVEHEYRTDRGLVLSETQDIVYLDTGPSAKPARDHTEPQGARQHLVFDETMLFRYSALTFNAHRIHYDHPYATAVEGYGGLVVHGPLQATLMLNRAAIAMGQTPGSFIFRGSSPLLAGSGFVGSQVADGGFDLFCANAEGSVTMKGQARFSVAGQDAE